MYISTGLSFLQFFLVISCVVFLHISAIGSTDKDLAREVAVSRHDPVDAIDDSGDIYVATEERRRRESRGRGRGEYTSSTRSRWVHGHILRGITNVG